MLVGGWEFGSGADSLVVKLGGAEVVRLRRIGWVAKHKIADIVRLMMDAREDQ